jgi:hypothetical protein
MVHATPERIAGLLILFLLAASLSLAEAAQPSKGETTKTRTFGFVASRPRRLRFSEEKGRSTAIQNPQQLVEKLQSAGRKAEVKEFQAGARSAVEVRAPAAGLAVLFVRKEFCDKIGPGPESPK